MRPFLLPGGPPGLPERFEAVQGLRAWAMLLVFFFHWNYLVEARWPNAFSAGCLAVGGWGTNVFLCVAGCFLHRSLSRRPEAYGEFLAKRFRRLYPVYAFVLTLVIGLDVLLGTGRVGLTGRWEDAALLAGNYLLLPALLEKRLILDVSWTLAYLAGFTLMAPAVSAVLRRWTPAWRTAGAGVLWACALGASVGLGWFPARVTLLAGGVLVWEALGLRGRWMIAGAIAAGAWLTGLPMNVGLVPAMVMGVLAGPQALRRWLAWRPLRLLGDRSYSFYLCHGLPLVGAGQFLLPRLSLWQALAVSPLMLAASLCFSECVYRLVEKPFREKPKAVRAPDGLGALAEAKG